MTTKSTDLQSLSGAILISNNDAIQLSKADFRGTDLATIPEEALLVIHNHWFKPIIRREEDHFNVNIGIACHPKDYHSRHDANVDANAVFNAVRVLRAEGRPFSQWDLNFNECNIAVCLNVESGGCITGADLLQEIEEIYEEVEETASSILHPSISPEI